MKKVVFAIFFRFNRAFTVGNIFQRFFQTKKQNISKMLDFLKNLTKDELFEATHVNCPELQLNLQLLNNKALALF